MHFTLHNRACLCYAFCNSDDAFPLEVILCLDMISGQRMISRSVYDCLSWGIDM